MMGRIHLEMCGLAHGFPSKSGRPHKWCGAQDSPYLWQQRPASMDLTEVRFDSTVLPTSKNIWSYNSEKLMQANPAAMGARPVTTPFSCSIPKCVRHLSGRDVQSLEGQHSSQKKVSLKYITLHLVWFGSAPSKFWNPLLIPRPTRAHVPVHLGAEDITCGVPFAPSSLVSEMQRAISKIINLYDLNLIISQGKAKNSSPQKNKGDSWHDL